MEVDSPLLRNLLGSLGIVAIMVAIGAGLPALDATMPSHRPLPAGEPYRVGGSIEIVPPPGSMLDVSNSRPSSERGKAVFVADSGRIRYTVVVRVYRGSLDGASRWVRYQVSRVRGVRLEDLQMGARTEGGVEGRQGRYTSTEADVSTGDGVPQPPRQGRYAVFLFDGRSVWVNAVGPDDRMTDAAADIDTTFASVVHRP